MFELSENFKETLNNQGKEIKVKNKIIKALFKRTETTTFLFTDANEKIEQGSLMEINDKKYLLIKDNTAENDIYRKSQLLPINQNIKIQKPTHLLDLNVNADKLQSSLSSAKGLQILTSAQTFYMPINNEIEINDRFFSGTNQLVWKVRDLNNQDGLTVIYAERDTLSSYDDVENWIADRFKYIEKPNEYVVMTDKALSLQVGNTITPNIKLTQNSEPYEAKNHYKYKCSVEGIVSIENNTIIGIKEGTTSITIDYKEKDTDKSTPAVIDCKVEAIPVKDIYQLTILNKNIEVENGDTQKINYKITKNDIEIQGKVNWVIDNPSIISIEGDVITGLAEGTTSISGIYQPTENDTYIGDNAQIKVIKAKERLMGYYSHVPTSFVDSSNLYSYVNMIDETIYFKSHYTDNNRPLFIAIIEKPINDPWFKYQQVEEVKNDNGIVCDIPYNSTYNGEECYGLSQGVTQTFKFSHLPNSKLIIKLSAEHRNFDIANNKYMDYTIHGDSITIECKQLMNYLLRIDVLDTTTNTYNTYNVRLKSLF